MNLLVTIAVRYSKACVMVSARKIIQPITIRENVSTICRSSLMQGSFEPYAATSFLGVFMPRMLFWEVPVSAFLFPHPEHLLPTFLPLKANGFYFLFLLL